MVGRKLLTTLLALREREGERRRESIIGCCRRRNVAHQSKRREIGSSTDWVEVKAEKIIEDFTDMNRGEINVMKLWKRHLRALHQGVGIVHMSAVVLR